MTEPKDFSPTFFYAGRDLAPLLLGCIGRLQAMRDETKTRLDAIPESVRQAIGKDSNLMKPWKADEAFARRLDEQIRSYESEASDAKLWLYEAARTPARVWELDLVQLRRLLPPEPRESPGSSPRSSSWLSRLFRRRA
jgi:hypothetical protein